MIRIDGTSSTAQLTSRHILYGKKLLKILLVSESASSDVCDHLYIIPEMFLPVLYQSWEIYYFFSNMFIFNKSLFTKDNLVCKNGNLEFVLFSLLTLKLTIKSVNKL